MVTVFKEKHQLSLYHQIIFVTETVCISEQISVYRLDTLLVISDKFSIKLIVVGYMVCSAGLVFLKIS